MFWVWGCLFVCKSQGTYLPTDAAVAGQDLFDLFTCTHSTDVVAAAGVVSFAGLLFVLGFAGFGFGALSLCLCCMLLCNRALDAGSTCMPRCPLTMPVRLKACVAHVLGMGP
jgi:hypothetical protein